MGKRRARSRAGKRVAIAAAALLGVGVLVAGFGSAWADTSLTAGKPASGSAACRASETPSKAVNGSVKGGLGDKWCSGVSGTKTLQVDLQSPQQIDRFVVRHAGSGGESARWNTRDFTISVSTDGAAFTRVVTVAGNTANVTDHAVTPVAARYLRLEITAPTSTRDGAARIYEFEAYAAKKPAPTPSPAVSASGSASPSAPTRSATVAPPSSAVPPPTTCHPDATATIKDYIGGHGETMTRSSCNADAAVYFDAELQALPASGTAWIAPFVTDVWRHVKSTYGQCAVDRDLAAPIGPGCANFGAPKPALAFMHQNKHGGRTVTNRFDGFSGFRTTLDIGDNGWKESSGVLHDRIVHEACHEVEGSSQGIHESPAFSVWGDSKWAEFCVYDFYARSGRTADANRVFDEFSKNRDNMPSGATQAAWFRDWFLPLWKDSGDNADVMKRYFALLAQNFPTRSENDGRNLTYTRRMTTGEFVHFMSAADNRDLSGRAASAFNSGFKRAEFEKAQRDFPALKY
jgi:hypothetical protein